MASTFIYIPKPSQNARWSVMRVVVAVQEVCGLFDGGHCAGLCACYYAERDGYWYALFDTQHNALLAYQHITVNRLTLHGTVIMVSQLLLDVLSF